MADGQVANPAPLGLAGFGLTTIVLSCMNAGLFPVEAASVVVPLAFCYGGLAQIIAGVLEYKNGNTFGMVAFVSYGTFWWWYALLLWTVGAGWIKPPHALRGGDYAPAVGRVYVLFVDCNLPAEPHFVADFSHAMDRIFSSGGR